jgi:hypothetical protein
LHAAKKRNQLDRAKSCGRRRRDELKTMASRALLVDQALAEYGPEASLAWSGRTISAKTVKDNPHTPCT